MYNAFLWNYLFLAFVVFKPPSPIPDLFLNITLPPPRNVARLLPPLFYVILSTYVMTRLNYPHFTTPVSVHVSQNKRSTMSDQTILSYLERRRVHIGV